LSIGLGAIMEYVNAIYKYKDQKVNNKIYNEALETLALLLSPFTPHLAEEMWEKLGHKPFISTTEWPQYDEQKIDTSAEAIEDMISQTISDIRSVLELTKMEKPNQVTLFISQPWKYDFMKELQTELKKTINPGEIIKDLMATGLKVYGQEITKLVPKFVKDRSKIPNLVLDQDTEQAALIENAEFIGREFNCKIQIVKSQEIQHPKTKQAMPSKPAIVVE